MRDSLILISEQIKAQLVAYNDYCTNWQDHRLTDGEKKTYTISEKINPDKLNFHRRKQSLGMHVPSIHGSRSNTESIYLAVSPPEKHPQLWWYIHTCIQETESHHVPPEKESSEIKSRQQRLDLIWFIWSIVWAPNAHQLAKKPDSLGAAELPWPPAPDFAAGTEEE